MKPGVKVVIVQGVCPHYRVPFFRRLAHSCDLTLLHGRGDQQGAYRNARQIDGFNAEQLSTLRCDLRFLHPYLQLSWFPGLSSRLQHLKPDVVVAPGVSTFPNTLSAMRHCRRFRIPIVIWDSGREVGKPMSWYRRLFEPLSSFILTRADACIAYSSIAGKFMSSVGVPGERIFIAQNTVDVEEFLQDRERLAEGGVLREQLRDRLRIGQDDVLLLYVGAIERRKRLEQLLDVGDELKERGQRVAIIMVGDGPHLAEIKADAARRAVKVHFPGRIIDGVGEYFFAADVFVLPGPGGLSINQAMAYGLPIIVWGGDGTERDLVEAGKAGQVVQSYPELLERTASLTENAELRREMGENSLRQIRKFDLGNMVDQFCRAFDFVLRNETR